MDFKDSIDKKYTNPTYYFINRDLNFKIAEVGVGNWLYIFEKK